MKRIYSLDSLRLIFMGMIFVSHLSFMKTGFYKSVYDNVFAQGGPAGVSFFILISGYALGLKYLDKIETVTLRSSFEFSFIRIKKFLKLHFFTLFLVMPLCINLLKKPLSFALKLLFNITLLQTWIPSQNIYFSFNAVAWYLSLTAFLYFIAPKALVVISKLSKIVGGGY